MGIIAFGGLCSVACGKAAGLEGTWRGEHALPPEHANNPYVANSIKKVELTFKPNGTYELSNSGIPKSGSVRASGDEALLDVEMIFGKPIETIGSGARAANPPIKLKVLNEGTLSFQDSGGLLTDTVILRRVSQPVPN